jgi:hypothetical protein
MGKYIKLSAEQKDDYRRLVQNANRRIARAQKAYAKAGLDIVPRALTGLGKNVVKEDWNSEKYAFSRSIKFATEDEYKAKLEFFRQFDPKDKLGRKEKVPTVTEYAKIQRVKTVEAIENILGEVPEGIAKRIAKMSAPELTKFWTAFSRKARRMGAKYSSNDAMQQTLSEYFPEDWKAFNNVKSENAMVEAYKRDMRAKTML